MTHEYRSNYSERVQDLKDIIGQTLIGVTEIGVSRSAKSASGDAVNVVGAS
jgi:hypothetical protein